MFESINSVPDISTIGSSLKSKAKEAKQYLTGEDDKGKWKIKDPDTLSYPEGSNYNTDNHTYIKIITASHTNNAKKSDDSRVDTLVGKTVDQTSYMIALPFPQEVTLSEQYTWGAEELGLASSLASSSGSENLASNALASTFNKLKSKSSSFTGLNLKGVSNIKDNRIINPHIAAMFKSVSYRSFSLSFDFAPRSEKEVNTIIDTIRAIRSNAAPSMSNDEDYIGFPNRFEVKLNAGEQTLVNHGVCVATSVNTNYTPDGIWATFRSGYPVHVKLDISFMETTIVTREQIMAGER